MILSEKDKERLDLTISVLKSIIDERIQHLNVVAEEINRYRVELACLEHCREEVV